MGRSAMTRVPPRSRLRRWQPIPLLVLLAVVLGTAIWGVYDFFFASAPVAPIPRVAFYQR